ncbi:MAG: SDR family oxidoreductase [Opitutales bacterium]|nr:SDR family oxidoreductase [Opitutales bacterium]
MLSNRSVLVTGAAGTSGVGFGVVQAVIEAGGRPIINGRSADRLAEAKERFPSAETVQGDISDAAQVDRIFAEAVEKVGQVDFLVNNAGIGLHKAPHLCEEADFDRLIGVDFRGAWLMARAWLRHVLGDRERVEGAAAMVNISSIHGQKTMPGYGLYAAAKGGVDALTRSLAVHYGRQGIRVNGVAPGYVHSEQNYDLIRNWTDNPEGWVDDLIRNHQAVPELIEPIDVGRVVVFLLSDSARAMTGQTLTVDGGSTTLLYPMNFV